jgi:RNA polymerase sigma factor for flagellar operon FliA
MRRHLGLVHFVARRLSASGVCDVEYDELVSAGTIGLAGAVESFEPRRGGAFSTYAATRIRGAILDDLRSRDWLPRCARRKHRDVSAAVHRLESRLGRAPSSKEIAAELQVAVEIYWQWQADIDRRRVVDLDAPIQGGDGDRVPLGETVPDPAGGEALGALAVESDITALRNAIADLPERDRTVFALYYYEDLTLRQIAEILHITESRVSQIRTCAIRKLRGRIDDRAA